MRRQITVRVRRGDKLVTEEATLWIDELPPEYRRGKNKKSKTRRHKRQIQEAMHVKEEERP